ncbi:major intrinsically disordered Notch2-binding receptor 1 [Corythoichthys intestinalis]|uniref:major intrinsically disordered Notch2-binding receptor 1 n=1 Tax=Corythoichthys intestinalis TaxID=161448 RepID=UPI0025A53FB3|nr:major intrinsically disordered Notch2-binding receptor 1 [Corythoichthys intestinalis]XP_061813710.1 major intrinsically disordered Notch2-binding receptor 1-like [Nerophis lumbriciformis]
MASLQQEYPGVLLGILEELANMRQWLTFQDLCRMVSTRFDLEHLVELRSLLFAAASQDPCFPATLFRDRVSTRGHGLSPIGVAADIVTIFNLIQMTGGATDDSQPTRAQAVLPVDQSLTPSLPGIHHLNIPVRERARAHSDSSASHIDKHLLFPHSNYSVRKRGSLPPDPTSFVSPPPVRTRAVSFDLPHTTLLYSSGQNPSKTMKDIYLPLETDSESSGDSNAAEVFETEQESTVDQKRNIFKKDFHNQPPLIPQVTINTESPSPKGEKGCDNHSFEMIPNPYPSPTAVQQSTEQRTKHENLDDLQDSTYFGPGSIPDRSPKHLEPPRSQRPIWSNKSHSLEDRVIPSLTGMGLESFGVKLPRRSRPAISKLGGSLGGEIGDIVFDGMKAQGTQTDPPDTRRLRSLVHADRLSFMTSLDDPDFADDDISAIFRFLDDISMCGSTGVLHPNDGSGGLNQDTHEARRGRLGQLQRLFHSLESSDDGLKASVCKLLLRMSQIERQLESLNDVKAEISQVLSALQRLDEKIPQPAVDSGQSSGGRWLEPLSGVSSFMSHPITPSESSEPQPLSVSEHLFPATSTNSLDWSRWNTPGEQTESGNCPGDLKLGKDGKKDVPSLRASKIETGAKGGADSKQANVSSMAKDWMVSFSKIKGGKSSHGKSGQEHQSSRTAKLISQKSSSLVEQVFSSSLFGNKESSLTGGLTAGKIIEPRQAEARGRSVWTVDDREARVSPFDLQARDSLNPNNMEFWMDDIYTPGYDALLRRKEAGLRRAKVCKLLALIAAAIGIILIIVIPICTIRS